MDRTTKAHRSQSRIESARRFLCALCVSVAAVCAPVYADSPASRNKAGNRLFEQGKYQEAEKAYLEAQASMPGRAELSYNLGNSLIKQKKYDQALQSLHQGIAKGDKALQANGWYNAGNALYDAGRFQDAAQAYIQSLRLNSADRDAKHNLELALKKLEERKQPQSSQQDSRNQKSDKKHEQQQQDQRQEARDPKQPNQPAQPEAAISKERALQILDALKNQELADQRKMAVRTTQRKPSARDW